MSYESDMLVTQLVNENGLAFRYRDRCDMARRNAGPIAWLALVNRYARHCRRNYDQDFLTVQILQAAADVAEYYEQHVREMDAA